MKKVWQCRSVCEFVLGHPPEVISYYSADGVREMVVDSLDKLRYNKIVVGVLSRLILSELSLVERKEKNYED